MHTTVFPPAKLNLALNVLGLRADGYHTLRSLMLKLPALADTMTLDLSPEAIGRGLTFTCSRPELTGSDNLVVRAYHAWMSATGAETPDLHIHLEKRIPSQAGLGGGSSDAASVLLYLNQTLSPALPPDALMQLGATLGADIPFFLQPEPLALAEGTGTHVTALPPFAGNTQPDGCLNTDWLILKYAAVAVPTPEAYQWLRVANGYQAKPLDALINALRTGQSKASWPAQCFNDFEAVVLPRFSVLQMGFNRFRQQGLYPLLCGSGSAVAVPLPTEAAKTAARAVCNALAQEGLDVWWL
jgi:4-diphosphocytidyl-2-C-methyl-D-erythritol kinase